MINELMRRRAMLMARQLPYDAEIEYLKSDSNAYINTGINGGNSNLDISCEFKCDSFIAYSSIYNNWISDNNKSTRLTLGARSGEFIASINNGIPVAANGTYNAKHSARNYTLVFIFDGVSHSYSNVSKTSNNSNIILFNRPTPVIRDIGCAIYWLKIYDNSVLVRDFIPVRIGTTGYMYDKVSKQLFGNAGSGSFILGNDI